ncbi:MAG: hypothetical protein IT536_11670 [Hyphomicrobiales bacterium]|nr:hypothetical protein [Hyphomicrobiales bacterium]
MRILTLPVTALLLLSLPALAQPPANGSKKGARPPAGTAAQIDCLKQHGASYDAATKRWIMHMTDRDVTARLDPVRACLSRATGRPRESIALPERPLY